MHKFSRILFWTINSSYTLFPMLQMNTSPSLSLSLSAYGKAPSDDAICKICMMSSWIWYLWHRSYRRPHVFWGYSCSPGEIPWVTSNDTRHLEVTKPFSYVTWRQGHFGYFFLFVCLGCLIYFNSNVRIWSWIQTQVHCEKFNIDPMSLLELWPCFSSPLSISRRDTEQTNMLK